MTGYRRDTMFAITSNISNHREREAVEFVEMVNVTLKHQRTPEPRRLNFDGSTYPNFNSPITDTLEQAQLYINLASQIDTLKDTIAGLQGIQESLTVKPAIAQSFRSNKPANSLHQAAKEFRQSGASEVFTRVSQ